jgi:hypothetical protein
LISLRDGRAAVPKMHVAKTHVAKTHVAKTNVAKTHAVTGQSRNCDGRRALQNHVG